MKIKFNISSTYIYSCSIIFSLLSVAKLINTSHASAALSQKEPILGLQYSHALLLSALAESAISTYGLFGKNQTIKILLCSGFAALLITYRLALWFSNWQLPCSCLGGLADGLNLTTRQADLIAQAILIYTLAGGYAALYFRQKYDN